MFDTATLGLFDTLVPIASIITISVMVGYILPKKECFGLFLLLWWTVSVFVSLSNHCFQKADEWSNHDWMGVMILLGFPTLILTTIYVWLRAQQSLRLYLYKKVPLWALFALNIYRLDGLSIILPFWRGSIPKYLGLQIIFLDVLIGLTSIPLACVTYSKGADVIGTGWPKDFVFFWNSMGLYDLASAYIVLLMNFLKVGGSYVTDPPLAMVGFHPIPLIVLFQAPLAMGIHILLMTSLDEVVARQTMGLPLHIQRLRRLQS